MSSKRLVEECPDPQTPKRGLSERAKTDIAALVLTAYTLAAGYAAYSGLYEPDKIGASFTAAQATDILKNISFKTQGGEFNFPVRYAYGILGPVEGASISIPYEPFSNRDCDNGITIGASVVNDTQGALTASDKDQLARVTSGSQGQKLCLDL